MAQLNSRESSLVSFAVHNIKMFVGLVFAAAATVVGLAVGMLAAFQAVVWIGT